jgi:hypothetical protein
MGREEDSEFIGWGHEPGWGALLRQRRRAWKGGQGSVPGEGGGADPGMGGCVRSGCDGASPFPTECPLK